MVYRILIFNYKHWCAANKETVKVFKRTPGSLGTEEINDGHKSEVEGGPGDLEFPSQRLNAWRGDFDDHEVEDPVRSGAQRSAFRPHAE